MFNGLLMNRKMTCTDRVMLRLLQLKLNGNIKDCLELVLAVLPYLYTVQLK